MSDLLNPSRAGPSGQDPGHGRCRLGKYRTINLPKRNNNKIITIWHISDTGTAAVSAKTTTTPGWQAAPATPGGSGSWPSSSVAGAGVRSYYTTEKEKDEREENLSTVGCDNNRGISRSRLNLSAVFTLHFLDRSF